MRAATIPAAIMTARTMANSIGPVTKPRGYGVEHGQVLTHLAQTSWDRD